MTAYFVVTEPLASVVTYEAAGLLANADVVISDPITLERMHQCVGPHAEQIVLVAQKDEHTYERELLDAIARHGHDQDAIVVRLIGAPHRPSVRSKPQELVTEINALEKKEVTFEVVEGVPDPLLSGAGRPGMTLPRSGPLLGASVVVTRARHQTNALGELLLEQGATPIVIPVIDIVTTDAVRARVHQALARDDSDTWTVFSSQNAVWSVLGTHGGAEYLARTRIACIGSATARVCTEAGLTVEFLPSVANAESFVDEFPVREPGSRVEVTFFAGDIARSVIDEGLHARGYVVDRVHAYETVQATVSPFVRHRAHGADAIIFTSPSTVRGAIAVFGKAHVPPRIISMGPITSSAITDAGLVVAGEARTRTLDALVEALVISLDRPLPSPSR